MTPTPSTQAKDRTMKVIYKHILQITDRQTLELGANDEPLSVQFQGGNLCLWVLHDTNEPKVPREFAIYGTGHPVEQAAGDYLGTVQQPSVPLVWHVFEVRRDSVVGRAA